MRIILLTLLLLVVNFCFAERFSSSFEGKISFVRETVFDTTYITVMVKGGKVRVEEYDKQSRHISTRIIDLNDQSVVAISPEKKLYTKVGGHHLPKQDNPNLIVKKTGNYKQINGYKCYQWRVKDTERNTEVAYWVTNERFDFFEKLISMLNRTERSLTLYQAIPENEGFFPILTEERTLLRKDKLKIAVLEITETNLHPQNFEVPNDYQPLRN